MEKQATLTFREVERTRDPGAEERARWFRDAMGCFATGVGVVTTLGPKGERIGLTVNSFASLSLDPPLILWCLSLDSGLVKHFQKGRRFNIVFLSAAQEALARKFARPGEERYKGLEAPASEDRVPLLHDAAGALECSVEAAHDGGDHVILIGRVLRYAIGGAEPLLFHKGRFRTF